ncbi:MAG TPA: SDR family oxidoreductase [Edaphobacter sp.]|jgi:NAD(P)-dependent dehydrogenase (short-subunit alcohol dehydrogenase family)/uncharacterized glyoxalase superfamily protein PhnB|nr:SDR family oxidoreductase [Edaphobacter sp.]
MATRIAPMLAVSDGNAAIKFYQAAFDAKVLWKMDGGDQIVAGLEIHGAEFFLATEAPLYGTRSPDFAGYTTARIELLVDDPYAVHKQAVTAGATSRNRVKEDHFEMSGPRPIKRIQQGAVVDPFGHMWMIGKVLERGGVDETEIAPIAVERVRTAEKPAERITIYPSLEGRVVLVTGGASGIGEAIVEAFMRQHARVVFLDIDDDAAHRLIERIGGPKEQAPLYRHCDLTNVEKAQQTVGEILSLYPAIDVLINNAGNDTRHTMEEVTPSSWDQTMAVNLKQQFFMAQAVIPSMKKAGRGAILNMSSICWVIPSTGFPVYATAKAAIVGMTRTLAHTVGKDGIRVNSVMPGAVQTERQKKLWLTEEYKAEILARQALKRMILPEEVARLMLFLASDDGAAITSQSYVIDGGWV